jgi:hypothetical protein
MAQQALGPGMTIPRRRAFFGLLDANGWAWAGVKAFVWLVIMIMLLGYIPDRAYYLTVNRAVDLGVIAWSPVNFCPPENETLPCPAPVGAVTPWHASPAELSLPQARTGGTVVQIGTKILYIGGSDGKTAQSTVFVAPVVGTGNFDRWTDGPPLPEARSDASVVVVAGVIYVIGGYDAKGAPTTTTYILKPDGLTGDLGDWSAAPKALTLPEARAAAAGVASPDGILLIGGVNAEGPVTTVYKSLLDLKGVLGAWKPEASLFRPQADATAAVIGSHVWVWGGHDAAGPVGAVQRGDIGQAAAEGLPVNPNAGKVVAWAINNAANLPTARDDAAGWISNGTLYLAGGANASGPQREFYWAVPTNAGDIPEWKHLDVSDLPTALRGASPVISGPNAILVGGQSSEGVVTTSVRSSTAPQAPFFRLGLVGVTVPGLKIEGEIGQQLGYLNAAGAGTVDFVLLIIVGWAFAHREEARRMVGRIVRRRR